MKKLFLIPSLLLFLFLGACDSSDDPSGSIELARPKKLSVTTELATATFKWDAVAKADGYAYALDQSSDYTLIDASAISVKVAQLSKGSHTFKIHATGNLSHTTDSADQTIEFEIDPTLPTPVPTYTKGSAAGEAIITWEPVKGAMGYAYKFNDAEWTTVGSDIVTVTQSGLSPDDPNRFTIYALGNLPDSDDSAEITITMIDTSVGVWAALSDGNFTRLVKTATGIYSATIDFKADDNFSILINNVAYGFTAFSGNGGVGTVNSSFATVPTTDAFTSYVHESVGQMSPKVADTEINKFWINTTADCQLFVKVDCTNPDNTPRYYLQLVETPDPSVILAQYFDLMTLGGNWISGVNARKASVNNATAMDGTEVAEAADITPATFGVQIASSTSAKPYIANRGLEGWDVTNCFEFAGLLRLSSPGFGVLTTPPLAALTGASKVTLTFDAVAFGGTTDGIVLKVLGGGTIASASVKIQGAEPATAIAPESGNTSLVITKVHCPKYANSAAKSYSNFTVVIEGATASTQISWDTTSIKTLNNARLCLDNIVVKKN